MKQWLAALMMALVAAAAAQEKTAGSSSGNAFWITYWAQPRVNLFGPEEEAFYQNMKNVMFPWNEHDEPSNPSALDDAARWLKEHPNVSFYIDGYSSSRGELIYNLVLSQKRADWVKHALISRGIPENRIRFAVGWGQLYPVCLELNDDCWSKNRLVRFTYAPRL